MDNISRIKKICIYGAGGVGGYFGGLIADYASHSPDSVTEVYFVARGSHLDEIRKNGLILNSKHGQGVVSKPLIATDSFETLPSPDLVVLTVKGYDLEGAVADISKNIKEDTVVIPLLNGVDIYERIRQVLKKGIVLPACVYVVSNIEKPGTVTQKGDMDLVILGKDPGDSSFFPEWVVDLFNSAKINYKWIEDPSASIWEKYMLIAPFALTTARYSKSFGGIIEDIRLKDKAEMVMNEIMNISKAMNIKMKDSIIQDVFAKVEKMPYDSKTSFQKDFEIKGKKNELDFFGGTIIRLGKKYGIKTAVTEELYDFLQSGG